VSSFVRYGLGKAGQCVTVCFFPASIVEFENAGEVPLLATVVFGGFLTIGSPGHADRVRYREKLASWGMERYPLPESQRKQTLLRCRDQRRGHRSPHHRDCVRESPYLQ
jgi:hypothetical protein